jgi:DNA modification methylase
VAALKLNRQFIGIEKNPQTFETAKARIGKALPSNDLKMEKGGDKLINGN